MTGGAGGVGRSRNRRRSKRSRTRRNRSRRIRKIILNVRMLDGDVTDAVEARSLSLNNQHIDIYRWKGDMGSMGELV